MGLRCLLGHDFGPSGIVREHEEDGSEMVVTEREVRLCRRCGEEQVLSESTEVRAIRTEGDVGIDRRDADAVTPASSTQGTVDSDSAGFAPETTALSEAADSVSAPEDGAETVTTGGPETTTADDGETMTADDGETMTADDSRAASADSDAADESNTSLLDRAEAGLDDTDTPDPATEDAVILDETDETPERGHGEWPDSGDVGEPNEPATGRAGDASAAGDTDPVDGNSAVDETAFDTADTSADDSAVNPSGDADTERSVAEEDAELIGDWDDDGDDAATNGHETANTGGSWPAHDGDDEGFVAGSATSGGPGIAYGNTIAPQSANGQSRDDGYDTSYLGATVEERDGDGTIVSAGSDGASERSPGVETEYYCPNCGHARPLGSSLRSGDICPECQQGYIAEREC